MTAEELKEALVSGNILYISDPQIANGIPHYHVFVKKIDGDISQRPAALRSSRKT